MSETTQQSILLESGTNEVEIAEILVRGQSYGLNVAKVQQIVQIHSQKEITHLPASDPSLLGTVLFRGESVPLIDLRYSLYGEKTELQERPMMLVSRFNNMQVAFLIEGAERIRRFRWDDLQPISPLVNKNGGSVLGTLTAEDREILVLDVERLTAEVMPETSEEGKLEDEVEDLPLREKRAAVSVFYAEDSAFVRNSIIRELARAGYEKVTAFVNGREALDHLEELEKQGNVDEQVQLLLTDIEMPQMDGLTLCRILKKEKGWKLPVVMFSSLIDEQMSQKCESVGASAWMSKPEIRQIVQSIDRYTLGSTD